MIKALILLPLLFFQSATFFNQNVRPSGGGKTQLFTESFAYTTNTDLVADAPTNWAYTVSGTAFEVIGNTIYAWQAGVGGNTGQPGFAKWIGAGTFNANQYVTATFPSITNVEMGPVVRISGTSGYVADCYSGGCRITKDVSGAVTNLTSFGAAIANGSAIELDASGASSTVLTLLVNGTSYQTVTDSSSPLTTGTVGIANVYLSSNAGDTNISNVKGGNL
jgi:hypothetical protein